MTPGGAPGSDFAARIPSLFGRLGFRLMAAVGLSLLPLALLAYVQSSQFQAEARARVEAALFGETLLAAAPQIEAIKQARGSAAALAVALPLVMNDPAACNDMFVRFVEFQPLISFAGFIPVAGLMTCASSGAPHDFSGDAALAAFLADPQPTVNVNRNGQITGESVLIFSQPTYAADGTLLGLIALSMPHRALGEGAARPDVPPNRLLSLMTFDAEGEILTAMLGIDTAPQRLPLGRPLTEFVGGGAMTFSGPNVAGDQRTFAVIPMVERSLYVLASWSPPPTSGSGLGEQIPLWAFPTAMWLASLVVAWLAAEHQVLRHVRSLRSSITAFAGGSRTVEVPDLDRAPKELRDMGDAYEQLVDSVLHDEAALEDTIHQKEVLLREVHHRVKNNLQLIASIMNLQMRKAVTPEARTLIKGLHDRVMSLSSVHRELYQTSGLTDVRADELLSAITTQVLRMGASPSRPLNLTTELDPIRLTPDQSVPLSLLLTEALTNVLKHAGGSSSRRIELTVSLSRLPEGRARLRIANSLPPRGPDDTVPPRADTTGMGEQLLNAFAMQLGGPLTIQSDDQTYVVVIDFPVRALSEGENRFDNAGAQATG